MTHQGSNTIAIRQKIHAITNTGKGKWTVPDNVYSIIVEGWGGGGAGVGNQGGAGGGGAYFKKQIDVTLGQQFVYYVGPGGARNTKAYTTSDNPKKKGDSGQDTLFGENLRAGGGKGGSGGGGIGGIAHGGDVNINGQKGSDSFPLFSENAGMGGFGGNAGGPGGSGGQGRDLGRGALRNGDGYIPGGGGNNYGSGGGGGAKGMIVVTYIITPT